MTVSGNTVLLYEQRPVYWVSGTMTSLITGDPNSDFIGQASAVNNLGEFVGQRQVYSSTPGWVTDRGFRTRPNGTVLQDTDSLLQGTVLPSGFVHNPDIDTPTHAYGVSEDYAPYGGGNAVGDVLLQSAFGSMEQPSLWGPRSGGASNPDPYYLSVSPFASGSVIGNARSGMMIGWVRAFGQAPVPALWNDVFDGPRLMNDAYRVYGVNSARSVDSLAAVSANGVITAQGTSSGNPRGFVLIHQPTGP